MNSTRPSDLTADLELTSGETWTGCESAIKAFEQAWQLGDSPSIDLYLVVEGADRLTLLAELVHVDLEFRLKRGQNVRVESYLSRYPALAAEREQLLELVAESGAAPVPSTPCAFLHRTNRRHQPWKHRTPAEE